MITKIVRVALLLLSIMLSGCAEDPTPLIVREIKNPYENQNGNFVLYVSNQSFVEKSVDILIKIDNVPIIHEIFQVENQHNWKKFTMSIPVGSHKIQAITQKGNAAKEQQFDVNGKHWAVLDYVYTKKKENQYNGPTFIYTISDSPISFL